MGHIIKHLCLYVRLSIYIFTVAICKQFLWNFAQLFWAWKVGTLSLEVEIWWPFPYFAPICRSWQLKQRVAGAAICPKLEMLRALFWPQKWKSMHFQQEYVMAKFLTRSILVTIWDGPFVQTNHYRKPYIASPMAVCTMKSHNPKRSRSWPQNL